MAYDSIDGLIQAGRVVEAAQLAERQGDHARAVDLYVEAGDPYRAAVASRAAGQLPRALNLVLQVGPRHEVYVNAARLAIALAASLRTVSQRLEDFLTPYLASDLGTAKDLDALFLLGQLYEVLHYTPQAQELFLRVARLDLLHPVHAHLRASAKSTMPEQTLEVQISRRELREIRKLVKSPQPLSAPAVKPGTRIAERYEVLNLVGTGGTASVYAVHDSVSGSELALKLFAFTAHDPLQEGRFRREVKVARALSHENIVRVYDSGNHRGRWYLTMELLDGTDLAGAATGLDLAGRCGLLLQALAGLGHAHAQRVVHRDIKPENMLVTQAGTLKLTDFGIAKGLGDNTITGTGSMGGTPYYVSPEQINDLHAADHRSDLYSMGVVAYELFTGQCPFDAPSITDLLMMHLKDAPRPMRELKPSLPARLDEIVRKLLEKERSDRFQSCEEVARALRLVKL